MNIINQLDIYITLHFIKLMVLISKETDLDINELIPYIYS